MLLKVSGRYAAAAVAAWALLGGSAEASQQPPNAAARAEQTDVREWLKGHVGKNGSDATRTPEPMPQRTSVLIAPIIGSKPSTGVVLGAGVSFEFPFGDLSDTYMSSTLTGASVSTKKQYSISSRLLLFGSGNRWAMTGDNHYKSTGQDTYGFGTVAASEDPVAVTYHSIRIVDGYLRRLPHRFYAGVGFIYQQQTHVEPLDEGLDWEHSPYVTYSQRFGFDLAGQTSAGVSAILRRDRRDSVSDPSQGGYLETTYRTYFADFLGGASTWQAASLDVRAYKTIPSARRQTLAVWGYGEFVTGGRAPYFVLPATGTDAMGRTGRGYAEGHFRGDRLVYAEIEYRAALRRDGLVGVVAFLNATAVASTFDGDPLFDSVAPGGGFGFRLRLDKRSRTNLCLDFGFGRRGSHGVYIALAEAF